MSETLRSKGGWWQFTPHLKDLTPFRTHGSLRGEPVTAGAYATGRLPAEHRDAARATTVDYVVFSYGTPIAWHDSVTGWVMPDERYSATTSAQQTKIRTAIGQLAEVS